MKHPAIYIITIGLLFSCSSNTKKPIPADTLFKAQKTSAAELKFLNTRVDFGDVKDNVVLTANYDFVNTGKDQLIINSVQPDCSCTSSHLSNRVTLPNDTGHITLKFSTHNKTGKVVMYSTVSANTKTQMYILRVSANVK